MTEARVTRKRLLTAMLLVGFAVTLWCVPGAWSRATNNARTTADEPQYLLSAISIGEDLDLDISDERLDGRYADFHEVLLPIQEERADDGSRVSPHDPLLPAVLALPVLVGGWLAAKLFLALLGGLLAAAILWVAVRRFDVPLRVAVLTVLAFGLAAPFAVYSTQVYPELPAALVFTVAIGALTGALRRWGLVLLAGTLVALPWLSVKYAPVVVTLAAIALWRLWRRGDARVAVGFVVGLACAAVAFLALHQLWYGGFTPYAAGSHFGGGELTVTGNDPDYLSRGVRLLGLLVDRGFGLAVWQPAFLLVVPAVAALAVRRPRHWVAIALPLAVGWLNATFVALTMHGWWWPGRQVVIVLPCAVLAIAWWAARYRPAQILVAIGLAIGAFTFAFLTVEVLTGNLTLIVDFERTANPIVRAFRELLPDGRLVPAGTDALRVAWALALVALAAWGVRSVRRPRAERSRVAPTRSSQHPVHRSSVPPSRRRLSYEADPHDDRRPRPGRRTRRCVQRRRRRFGRAHRRMWGLVLRVRLCLGLRQRIGLGLRQRVRLGVRFGQRLRFGRGLPVIGEWRLGQRLVGERSRRRGRQRGAADGGRRLPHVRRGPGCRHRDEDQGVQRRRACG